MNKKHIRLVLLGAVVGIIIGIVLSAGLNITHNSNATPAPVAVANERTPEALAPEAPPALPPAGDNQALLDALSNAFADVAEQVNPSVVTIFTTSVVKAPQMPVSPFGDFFGDDFFKRFFQVPAPQGDIIQQGLGSGVIVRSDGIILTNYHVVKDADEIKVRLYDGTDYDAEVKGKDPRSDLAVLKIDKKGLKAIKLGDSDKVRVGQWVLAIGSPLDKNLEHTVTAGIVSGKGRNIAGLADYQNYIQTDAAINPGNSGGALVNLKGELIGINTAILTKSGGYMGVGFAIPVNLAKKVMNDILAHGKVIRGWLGVVIQDVTPQLAEIYGLEKPEGAVVTEVQDGSPADKGGLKEEDIIIEFNGQKIRNRFDLSSKVANTEPGTTVKIKVLRDGKEKTLKVKLGEYPEEEAVVAKAQEYKVDLGFKVKDLTPDIRNQLDIPDDVEGVVVTSVRRGSRAFLAGLRRGDVILKVNRKPVKDVDDFREVVNELKPGAPIALYVQRGDNRLFVTFKLPKK